MRQQIREDLHSLIAQEIREHFHLVLVQGLTGHLEHTEMERIQNQDLWDIQKFNVIMVRISITHNEQEGRPGNRSLQNSFVFKCDTLKIYEDNRLSPIERIIGDMRTDEAESGRIE